MAIRWMVSELIRISLPSRFGNNMRVPVCSFGRLFLWRAARTVYTDQPVTIFLADQRAGSLLISVIGRARPL